jgi:hypothetical protein
VKTRRVSYDMTDGSGRISSFTVEVTRDDSSDLGPEYRCELLSGDCEPGVAMDDVEAAAIDVAEEEWAELAAKARKERAA